MREVKVGSIYRHFKGSYYKVHHIVKHTESGEDMVVYEDLSGDRKWYARPLDMFNSEVDHTKYPEVTQKYRFEELTSSEVVVQFKLDLFNKNDLIAIVCKLLSHNNCQECPVSNITEECFDYMTNLAETGKYCEIVDLLKLVTKNNPDLRILTSEGNTTLDNIIEKQVELGTDQLSDLNDISNHMIDTGICIRAIPRKVRHVVEYNTNNQILHPDSKVKYLPEYGREMLVEWTIPEKAGKFLVQAAPHNSSIIQFSGNYYYDTLQEALLAVTQYPF